MYNNQKVVNNPEISTGSPSLDQPASREDALETLRKRLLDPSLPEAAIAPLEAAIAKLERRMPSTRRSEFDPYQRMPY